MIGGTGTDGGGSDTVEILSLDPKCSPIPQGLLRPLPPFPKTVEKGFAFPSFEGAPHLADIMEGAIWRMDDAAADGTWRRVGKMRERRGRFSAACYHRSTGAVFAGGISGLDVKYLGRHLQHCTLPFGYSEGEEHA